MGENKKSRAEEVREQFAIQNLEKVGIRQKEIEKLKAAGVDVINMGEYADYLTEQYDWDVIRSQIWVKYYDIFSGNIINALYGIGFTSDDLTWVKNHLPGSIGYNEYLSGLYKEYFLNDKTVEQIKKDNNIPLEYAETADGTDLIRAPERMEENEPEEPQEEERSYIPAKCAADVQDEVHRYLWKPYIPEEDYSILMAAAGTGKTMFCCWLAAQVTNGGFINGDTDFEAQLEAKRTGSTPAPGNVLYISSEELAGELRHRFVESGGDPTRFYIYDREDSIDMNFTDGFTDFLYRVKLYSPKLVIIDPWQAFIGQSIDVNKINHVRPAMQKLALIAKKCSCSIVLISHVNKKPQAENINNAAIGSSEFVNAARSGLMLIYSDDPEDTNGRILVHTKVNYAAAGDSLKFHITPFGGFEYDGTSLVNRAILEAAARNRKTVTEMMALQTQERVVKADLIEAIKSMAIPGESVIVAYEEMIDTYGEEIFGGSSRPGNVIKKLTPDLKQLGIVIETSTVNGNHKMKRYNGGMKKAFEIYKKAEKDR